MSFLLPLFMATGGSSVVYELSKHRAFIPETINRIVAIPNEPSVSGSESSSAINGRTYKIGVQVRIVKIEKQQRTVFVEYESRKVSSEG